MKFVIIVFLSILALILNSCFINYGNYTKSDFTALKKFECNEKK